MGDIEWPVYQITYTDKHDGEERYVLVFAHDEAEAQERARSGQEENEYVLRIEPYQTLTYA